MPAITGCFPLRDPAAWAWCIKARDQRLDRTVALKFLPAELNASEREKERFLREARTASSLDHPNIGVIHGIEETEDGFTFIVMAYYEGSSLAQRIQKGR